MFSVSRRPSVIAIRMIPLTRTVDKRDEKNLWDHRKHLFFKPADGFGSKATYRGDKLTKRVWGEILEGDYVVQGLIPPGHRAIAGRQACCGSAPFGRRRTGLFCH